MIYIIYKHAGRYSNGSFSNIAFTTKRDAKSFCIKSNSGKKFEFSYKQTTRKDFKKEFINKDLNTALDNGFNLLKRLSA